MQVSPEPLIQVSPASPKAPEFAKFEIKEPVGQTGVHKRLTHELTVHVPKLQLNARQPLLTTDEGVKIPDRLYPTVSEFSRK